MWIMLIVKLPTDPSPPKMAIFWSVPWPDPEHQKYQEMVLAGEKIGYTDQTNELDATANDLARQINRRRSRRLDNSSSLASIQDEEDRCFNKVSPNWIGARRIAYLGENIRVFPHEFTEQSVANMREYIFSDVPSHELVVSNAPGEMMMRDIKSGTRKTIYDAALIDGCNNAQALATAWGKDITLPDAEFPPIGWYRCTMEYTRLFCTPRGLIENFSR